MNKPRKKFHKDVIKDLEIRSKNKCECCGLDITVDKHHIWEFAQGGPDISINILCLCPTCHRILPKVLDINGQKYIQKLNFDKRSDTFSFFSTDTKFEVGSNIYENATCILKIENKSVIYPYKLNGRFYVNVIMLDGFDPYLLVIGNRAIYESNKAIVASTPNSLEITLNHRRIIKLQELEGKIKCYLDFIYNGKSFKFNEEASVLPGNIRLQNNYLENNNIELYIP